VIKEEQANDKKTKINAGAIGRRMIAGKSGYDTAVIQGDYGDFNINNET
jgi:hypothetical protein